MTVALILLGFGAVCLLLGWYFFYMNTHSPLQTPFPAVLLPLGAVAVILALGKMLP